MDKQKMHNQLNELLALGGEKQYENIRELLLSNEKIVWSDKGFTIAKAMLAVCEQEIQEGRVILFEKVKSLEELVNRYTKLMFYVRRLDFDNTDENIGVLNQFLIENKVSLQELFIVLYYGTVHREKVSQIIKSKIMTGELEL